MMLDSVYIQKDFTKKDMLFILDTLRKMFPPTYQFQFNDTMRVLTFLKHNEEPIQIEVAINKGDGYHLFIRQNGKDGKPAKQTKGNLKWIFKGHTIPK